MPLYKGCKISLGESELLLLMFSLRHKLTARALDDLIDLVNCHTPCIVHQSKYYLLKQYKSDPPKQNFFCENCHGLLDTMNAQNTQVECSRCLTDNNLKKLQASSGYFLTFTLKDQIKKLLETNIGTKLCWDYNTNDTIDDVISGTMYRKLKAKKYNTEKWISLQWNTDGIQVFKSSKISVWPIQVMINELPYNDRRENILLAGLWYSAIKPDMNTFLYPLTKELCDLQNNGIDLVLPSSKFSTNIKVHSIIVSVDSVARPMIQNIKQFNGMYGCPYCLNKGVIRSVGRGQSRMYVDGLGPKRTLQQHLDDCDFVNLNGCVRRGVKGASVLLLLQEFNIVKSFVPDYMHAVLLGVVKTFVEAWFDSSNSSCDWYLGRKVREFDAHLLNIKPTSEVTRTSRSIHDRKQWKASEWRTFLLYTSTVCLQGLLPLRYYKHWHYLIIGIYTLLQNKTNNEQINYAEFCLNKFVSSIPNLYGEHFMKFNVHLLLHLPKHVKMWGCLWAWSAFPFEHFNGNLCKLFQGTQGVPEQICKNYQLERNVRVMISDITTMQSLTQYSCANKLFKKLSGYLHVTNAIQTGPLTTFGKQISEDLCLTLQQKVCIENKIDQTLPNTTEFQSFHRFILDGMLIHTTTYQRLKKRHNSTVQLNDGEFVDISHLLQHRINKNCDFKSIIIGNQLIKIPNINISPVLKTATVTTKLSNNIVCFFSEELKSKCFRILYNDTIYVTPIVNSFERD